MRFLLAFAALATVVVPLGSAPASAQPYRTTSARSGADRATEIRALDRRVADLDRQIDRLDDEIYAIRRDLGGVRGNENGLDAERVRFQDAVRDYQRDAEAYRVEADRVRAMYDDLVRYGGSDYDRRAYDDARYRLEDDAERLRGEAQRIDAWNAELNDGYRGHASSVRQSAGRGQRLAQRRADLRHERDVLVARRARLEARRRW